ncbi:MAG: class I SAM-dependent methyltransferase [Terriglobia bacterium]
MARIIDVGCGNGASLRLAGACSCRLCVGVDIDLEALRDAKLRMPWAHFVMAAGERLPFKDAAFDHLICRVGLVLMPIRPCLAEMNRVLEPGGTASLNMHDVRFAAKDLARVVPLLSGRALAGRLWAIVNGLAFVVTGTNYRLPKARGLNGWETWQTRGSMRRALRRFGFERFEAPLVFNATKRLTL